MNTLIKNELYKIIKKKSTLYCFIFLILVNISFAVISKLYPKHFIPKELFVSNFATNSFIGLILIGTAASIISSEFEYGTMKNMITHFHSRKKILLSKWSVLLIYSLFLYLFFSLLSYINKVILFNKIYSLSDTLTNEKLHLWEYWVQTIFSNFITTWLILSAVLLVSTLLKRSSLAIAIGIIGYFAIDIIGRLTAQIIQKWTFLKWNPINLLNYSTQIAEPELKKITCLNLNQMLIGIFIYIAIFMLINFYVFLNKEV